MPSSPLTLDDLGIQGCLGLGALLLAQERRLPVAPTRRMTLALMVPLRDHGVIETPWPEARWELDPTADETPIEQIQWRYVWPHYMREGLLAALGEFLDDVPTDDQGLAWRARLWFDLGIADTERYFETLLAKNRFDPAWAQDLGFLVRELSLGMPLAQWRYCCWAAVRRGASIAQQEPGTDGQRLRDGIFAELKRRAGWVAAGGYAGCSFAPSSPMPGSAAARLFVTRLTRLGAAFWLTPTSWEAMLARSHTSPSQPVSASVELAAGPQPPTPMAAASDRSAGLAAPDPPIVLVQPADVGHSQPDPG